MIFELSQTKWLDLLNITSITLTNDWPMITKNFALNITTCISGLSFSFDELIIETQALFEKEGFRWPKYHPLKSQMTA